MGLARIVTLTGASASGKSTVAKELMDHHDFSIVTSTTTRLPRDDALPGECEHLTAKQFKGLVQSSAFAWNLQFAGNHYGTKEEYLTQALESQGSPHLMLLVPSAVDTLYGFLRDTGYDPEKLVLSFCFATPTPEMITDRMQRRSGSQRHISQNSRCS